MTRLFPILAGTFKLDGGAMFGVVPRTLWERLNPPDDKNLCTWALRCLLVVTDQRKILIDTGIGIKQDEKFMSHFYPSKHLLHEKIAEAGFDSSEITDVFLTHLHFDHCGGALDKANDGTIIPAFPNATYWTCKSHFDWALNPNARERASFLKENIIYLTDRGILKFIPEVQYSAWFDGITIFFAYGHTEAMMIPMIPFGDTTVAFCADLLPSSYHVGMPYVMSYDIRPLTTLEEKSRFFERMYSEKSVLFLEHDPQHECIKLTRDERGRYTVGEYLTVESLSS